MRTRTVLAIFGILIAIGIYLTMQFIVPKSTNTPGRDSEERLLECYKIALECEEGKSCEQCFDACTDIKNQPIKEGAVENCKLGNAEEIMSQPPSNETNSS